MSLGRTCKCGCYKGAERGRQETAGMELPPFCSSGRKLELLPYYVQKPKEKEGGDPEEAPWVAELAEASPTQQQDPGCMWTQMRWLGQEVRPCLVAGF